MFSEEERRAMLNSGPVWMPSGTRAELREANEDWCEVIGVHPTRHVRYHATWRSVAAATRNPLRRFVAGQLMYHGDDERGVEAPALSREDFQFELDYITWLKRLERLGV